MAVIIRVFSLVVLSLLLLEIVSCQNTPNCKKNVEAKRKTQNGRVRSLEGADADMEKNCNECEQTPERIDDDEDAEEAEGERKTSPLALKDLMFTRINEINAVTRRITDTLEDAKKEMLTAEKAIRPIRTLKTASAVEGALSRTLALLGKDCREKKRKIKDQLCLTAQHVKAKCDSVITSAKAISDNERHEFLDIMNNIDSSFAFEDKIKCLIVDSPDYDIKIDELNNKVNPKDYPKNIHGKKNLAYKKIQVAYGASLSGIEKIVTELEFALNTFFDALISLKHVEREMRSTREYPENIETEEAIIKTALALENYLGCSEAKTSMQSKNLKSRESRKLL